MSVTRGAAVEGRQPVAALDRASVEQAEGAGQLGSRSPRATRPSRSRAAGRRPRRRAGARAGPHPGAPRRCARSTAATGWRPSTAATLATDAGLAGQGVEDGAVLVVAPDVDDVPPRRHDDVAEAMADLVELGHGRWDAADRPTGRAPGRAPAAAHSGPGRCSAGRDPVGRRSRRWRGGRADQRRGRLSRVRGDSAVAVGAAWIGCAYAAVAGLLLPGTPQPSVRRSPRRVGEPWSRGSPPSG